MGGSNIATYIGCYVIISRMMYMELANTYIHIYIYVCMYWLAPYTSF